MHVMKGAPPGLSVYNTNNKAFDQFKQPHMKQKYLYHNPKPWYLWFKVIPYVQKVTRINFYQYLQGAHLFNNP